MLAFSLLFSACGKVEDPTLFPAFEVDTPVEPPPLQPSSYNENRNLYFGDLHIHTSLSTDAFVMGVRSMPDDAYRFAKGHAIRHAAGYSLSIDRPLDFAAVTDHAEYLGQARHIDLDVPLTGRPLRDLLLNGSALDITRAWLATTGRMREQGFAAGPVDGKVNRESWQEVVGAAEAHYEPGLFTTFVGYEWSAHVGDVSVHIHRNVIYRGGEAPVQPFSSLDGRRPEDLWAFLEREEKQGRTAIAIPHNANVSRGNMYAMVDSMGDPFDADYAETRNRFEPVHEILQIKGASEVHPLLSTDDEFADFSIASINPVARKATPAEHRGSYSRYALLAGLEFGSRAGFNPYRFGVIGASDSHNASSPVEESNYSGKLPMMDGSAGLRTGEAMWLPAGINPATSWSSGGLAGVWAEENTRESLFDALRRKETFATSGPRISVRFFAGPGLSPSILSEQDPVAFAYRVGVPMGGELKGPGDDPGFLVMASKDPVGANLDRIQIVKGWVNARGESRGKVFDVAVSPGRRIDSTGRAEPVASTVDIANADYTNTVGAPALNVVWRDPAFDPDRRAFYYVRVLEIPTPRWSTYDAKKLGSEPLLPAIIQERAITSAIRFLPD